MSLLVIALGAHRPPARRQRRRRVEAPTRRRRGPRRSAFARRATPVGVRRPPGRSPVGLGGTTVMSAWPALLFKGTDYLVARDKARTEPAQRFYDFAEDGHETFNQVTIDVTDL